jgi:hypothetical protein
MDRTPRLDRTPRRGRPSVAWITALAAVVVLALAATAGAYTIYLKDGSTIIAKEKYEIRGAKAFITLPSGTRTVLDAAEIDVARTDKANGSDYGTAMVLEGGEVKEMTEIEPAPRQKTLADLMAERPSGPRDLPGVRRRHVGDDGVAIPQTEAGYPDLLTLPPRPFSDLDIAAEIKQIFHGQGIDLVEVYQGSETGRPLLNVTTNSEASVFRSLAVAASALLRLRERYSSRIDTLELVMTTPTRERAGQFEITPEMARQLISREVDVQTFYLAHLQY